MASTSIRIHKGHVAILVGILGLVSLILLMISHHSHTDDDAFYSAVAHGLSVKAGRSAFGISDSELENELTALPKNLNRKPARYPVIQTLRGLVFTETSKMGDRTGEISSNVTLSVVKSLSPSVISHVKQIFNDDFNENVYFATIPAMIKLRRGVKIVQRIWLAQFEMMRNKYRNNGKDLEAMFDEWENSWQENHLYEMDMDENYNVLHPGSILGIPTTTNIKFTYKSDGAMDPRLATVGGNPYLFFHTWLVDKNSNDVGGRVHLYDMTRHIKRKIWPHIQLQRTEINWIPIDVRGQLHFTYSIDPLRVMKCDPSNGDCQFIHEQEGSALKENGFRYTNDHLRGGTPWVLYKYPYYISVGHSVAVTYRPSEDFAIYNANLIVMSVDPWRVVYVSRNIEAHRDWLSSEPIIRNHTIKGEFWYPSGIILWDEDTIDISCHLNDASGHILRLNGISNIMKQVMAEDARASQQTKGPKVKIVQQYVLESAKDKYKDTWTFYGDIVKKTVEGVDLPG